ncbi:Uncharacterised protein [Mycobacterium tuberculosis]|uniref:Uncharacterized protein n=1 Tax=Mycobacterium tuberculosis TaxID=1773 RepID=A0A0U0SVD9_MYCTX|nr:Uncharacterised protein [Mycobacterium tuberculosis]
MGIAAHQNDGGLLRSAMYASLRARSALMRWASSAARVRRRRGIIRPRASTLTAAVDVWGSSAVVVCQVGKKMRLPGWVV